MSWVILAEKPSQAKDYAAAFKSSASKNGYIEVEDKDFFSDKAYITWGFGHLVELVEPKTYKEEWGKWNLDSLPMIPNEYKFQVPADKQAQFKVVKKLLRDKATTIVVATDPDREGENIARSIVSEAGVSNKPIKRLWTNSLLPDQLRKAFSDLKDGDDYINMYHEAQTRQISDWLVGMNLSRLYTLLFQKQGIHEVFSIGRVQTPTLFLIYQRKMDIEKFVSKPFYEIFANISTGNGDFKAKHKEKFNNPNDIKNILSKHSIKENNEALIQNVIKESKTTKSPKLYSLSKLQSKANKVWKYSPQLVLDTVQSLYDKKILSYPRTDTQYIGEGEYEYLKENITSYQGIVECEFEVAYSEPRKRYVDGTKVMEHYAIIPTQKIPSSKEIEGLSNEEKTIYFEVMKNTIAMFANDYEYEETKIEADINGLSLHATGKVEKKKGWKELFSNQQDEENKEEKQTLPLVEKGEKHPSKIEINQGKTKPPKPYTEGQLINMMATAGKSLEDEDEKEILKETEGIGTEATRAAIIETIKQQNYISVVKNKVNVTPKGEVLCKAIENTLLASPGMTANWEKHLRKVGDGNGTQDNFLKNIHRLIEKMISDAPDRMKKDDMNQKIFEVKDQLQTKKPKKKRFKKSKPKKAKA